MSSLLDEIMSDLEYPGMEMEEESFEYETRIDKSSQDFADNYIDNFVSFQMKTPDSTSKDHYFKIFFANKKEKKLHINQVPGNMPAKMQYNGMTIYKAYIGPKQPDGYEKDAAGLIYPLVNGKVTINQRFTPNLVNLKTKIVLYQQYLQLMELGAAFGSIISTVSGLSGITSGPINKGTIKK